jgi:hypothetical protein
LSAQERHLNTGLSIDEQHAFIGMTLTELIERFGPPRNVFAARGNEIWQDDVVFQYTGVDFYIFRDRVWQVRFVSTHGISDGDTRWSAMQTLGSMAEDRGDHLLLPITGKDWPLMLRINFSNLGQVSAIFLYRSNF